jgi:hypothetical protein
MSSTPRSGYAMKCTELQRQASLAYGPFYISSTCAPECTRPICQWNPIRILPVEGSATPSTSTAPSPAAFLHFIVLFHSRNRAHPRRSLSINTLLIFPIFLTGRPETLQAVIANQRRAITPVAQHVLPAGGHAGRWNAPARRLKPCQLGSHFCGRWPVCRLKAVCTPDEIDQRLEHWACNPMAPADQCCCVACGVEGENLRERCVARARRIPRSRRKGLPTRYV